MTVQATIIIPTFNHGPTLLRSVSSALRQTVRDVEVVVIGDGVPDTTRSIMAELTQADERVRFIDRAKHASRAEPHRHAAVLAARGRIVCYLSDDDLYLPDHVETMLGLLRVVDFAHAVPLRVEADGSLRTWTVDLALPDHQRHIAEVENRIPLSAGAHTREAYLGLGDGWTAPPAGTPSDLHMWRKFLAQPGYRFASACLPTLLVFPSPLRRDWNLAQRVEELDRWSERLEGASGRAAIVEELLRERVGEAARTDAAYLGRCRALAEVQAQLGCAQEQLRAGTQDMARALEQIRQQEQELGRRSTACAELGRELNVVRGALEHERQARTEAVVGLALMQCWPEATAVAVLRQLRRPYRLLRRLTAAILRRPR
ncbi:MAG: glycosyltransferase [Gemmataceae bacterium]|nr:glycosyltransferase [Gemmataceae bacterium]